MSQTMLLHDRVAAWDQGPGVGCSDELAACRHAHQGRPAERPPPPQPALHAMGLEYREMIWPFPPQPAEMLSNARPSLQVFYRSKYLDGHTRKRQTFFNRQITFSPNDHLRALTPWRAHFAPLRSSISKKLHISASRCCCGHPLSCIMSAYWHHKIQHVLLSCHRQQLRNTHSSDYTQYLESAVA